MAHLRLHPDGLRYDGIIDPHIGTIHAVDYPLRIQGLKQFFVEIIHHQIGNHEMAVIIKALAEINAEPVGGLIVPASRAIQCVYCRLARAGANQSGNLCAVSIALV